MPSQSGVVAWSKTASENATADSAVNYAEGQAPSTLNDAGRGLMSSVAKYRDDTAGSLVTSGTSTAYTLTTNQVFSSLTVLDGQELTIRFNAANGASPTLNVDTLGAKAIRINASTAVPTGFIEAGSIWRVTYDDSIPAFILNGVSQVQNVTSLTASGTVTGGDLVATDDLTVGDDASIGGTLTVDADVTVGDDLTVTDDASVGGNLTVSGKLKASGNVVQVVYATPYTDSTQLTEIIPADDTTPLVSEGTEILTKAITPTSSSNQVEILVDGFGFPTGTGSTVIVALFRGSTCIRAFQRGSNSVITDIGFSFTDSPATTSSTAYSVRIGATGVGTVYMNGTSAGRRFNGTASCTMSLKELEAQ
jgi:hypothetical protein